MVSKRPLFALMAIVLACCCVMIGCATTNPPQMASLQFTPDQSYQTPSINIKIAPEFQLTPDTPILPDLFDNSPRFDQRQPQRNSQPRMIPAVYYSDRDPSLPNEPVQTILAGHRSYSRSSCTTNTTGQRQTLRYRLRVRSISRGGTCCNL